MYELYCASCSLYRGHSLGGVGNGVGSDVRLGVGKNHSSGYLARHLSVVWEQVAPGILICDEELGGLGVSYRHTRAHGWCECCQCRKVGQGRGAGRHPETATRNPGTKSPLQGANNGDLVSWKEGG